MKKRFRIKARRDIACPEVYSNYCEANHSPFDVTLTFCNLSGIAPEDLEHVEGSPGEAVVYADPKTRVILPFRILPGMIKMLKTQMRAIEEAEGDEPPDFRGTGFPTVH